MGDRLALCDTPILRWRNRLAGRNFEGTHGSRDRYEESARSRERSRVRAPRQVIT